MTSAPAAAPVAAPAPTRPDDPGPDPVPALRGTGLEKRFGDAVALAGVDLDLRRGESVAVMGPSGSGKSTLLHCLAGITPPDGGTVWLDGRRIDNPPPDPALPPCAASA